MVFLFPATLCACRGLHRFFAVLLLLAFCFSTKLWRTASRPSLRRANSMTSSTMIVLRPACLNHHQSNGICKHRTSGTYFEKLSRSWLVFSICAQTISVSAPMKCGVALTPSLRVSSSTILPIENHRAALSGCKGSAIHHGD